MSRDYDKYLEEHKAGVRQAYAWMTKNLPSVIAKAEDVEDLEWHTTYAHDFSKGNRDEYDAYDKYFYGRNRSFNVVADFRKAWLLHIHRNPHHWQYWVLINDDPKEGEIILDMPYNYIIEMICDWWSFSIKSGDLLEIFKWYDERKDYMKLSDKTRERVNYILGEMKKALEVNEEDV